jgi:hypothetical protein
MLPKTKWEEKSILLPLGITELRQHGRALAGASYFFVVFLTVVAFFAAGALAAAFLGAAGFLTASFLGAAFFAGAAAFFAVVVAFVALAGLAFVVVVDFLAVAIRNTPFRSAVADHGKYQSRSLTLNATQ